MENNETQRPEPKKIRPDETYQDPLFASTQPLLQT
jgi:hypothetical protein